jgi:hypothetical protein
LSDEVLKKVWSLMGAFKVSSSLSPDSGGTHAQVAANTQLLCFVWVQPFSLFKPMKKKVQENAMI